MPSRLPRSRFRPISLSGLPYLAGLMPVLAAMLLLAACAPKQISQASEPVPMGAPVPKIGIPEDSRLDLLRDHTVLTGLDVLEQEGFARLKGKKVGLIANHSALNRNGVHLLDLVLEHPEVQLVALFSPEHGFRGTADEKVQSGREETTGLPLYSLYGETTRPTPAMLKGIDVLVFDIQDIGARYYTYISTMGICMEEAERHGITFMVLDRPNPIGGWWFDGPIQDEDLVGGFTAFLPMPVAHGMTIGELALLFNTHYGTGADLQVVEMKGWYRDLYFDETGLPWVNPSPNMRSVDEEILYPMVGLAEGANVSVGRGTDRPFEYLGAPWIDGGALAETLRARNLPGLRFIPIQFVPYDRDVTGAPFPKYPYVGETCGGVRIVITNRWAVSPVQAGLHLLDALHSLYPTQFELDKLRGLVGAQWVLDAIQNGDSPESIIQRWTESSQLHQFAQAREKVLLYGIQKP